MRAACGEVITAFEIVEIANGIELCGTVNRAQPNLLRTVSYIGFGARVHEIAISVLGYPYDCLFAPIHTILGTARTSLRLSKVKERAKMPRWLINKK
jgi:hypothetical protein